MDKLLSSQLETQDLRILKRMLFGSYLAPFLVSLLLTVLSIPVPFLPDRRGKVHLPVSMDDYSQRMLTIFLASLLIFSISAFFFSSKILLDLITQIKLSGNATITRKWVSKKSHYLQLSTMQRITVKKDVFNSLTEGNTIAIIMAKYSKYVFKLEKI